jgi:SAM-dependent methyltransferase
MVLAASSECRRLISPRFSSAASTAPTNFQPSQLPYIDEVKSRLAGEAYKLKSSACPCGETRALIISEVDRYGLPLTFVLCAACGTIRIDPYLDALSLEDFYVRFFQQMYARATDIASYFARQKNYGEKILALARTWLKPGSRVYEVGCGAGGALDIFQRNGYQVAGCDYSAELIAAGEERGVRNLCYGSLKDIQAHLPEVKADLIYLNHVFEHMNDPLSFLEECRMLLAPGGRIIITVPDVSKIDSFACPAGDLMQFLHIAHKYNFSFEGIRRLGRRASYRVGRLAPDPKIQTPHSIMPELWIELVVDEVAESQSESVLARRDHGDEMLKYLRRTEKLYSVGLCRGQLLARLKTGKNNLTRLRRVTPAKVVRKIRGIS